MHFNARNLLPGLIHDLIQGLYRRRLRTMYRRRRVWKEALHRIMDMGSAV